MNPLPMLASVDLGSNSFRLQICTNNNGQLQVIENIKQMVRLAGGLDENKNLDEASKQRALTCLAQFGERLRGFSPENVRAVATNTFRVAKNIAAFHTQAEEALGFPIEIIAGREEARLIYTGVVHTFNASGQKMLIIDIGGGSTEFIIGNALQPTLTESLPLGCVSYSKRFFSQKTSTKEFQAAINAARGEIQRIAKSYKREGWDIALGTSGTAKAIAAVIAAENLGQGISLNAMKTLQHKIIHAGSVKKAKLSGIKPERIEVFAGGLAVLTAAFEELNIKEMVFNEAALRDGVFYDLIGRNYEDDMREQTALQFQERYHVSKNQAARVAKTAERFFNSLTLGSNTQELAEWHNYLRWAAMLHEIGLDIAHTGYHKHSAYILAQADMPGFSRDEQNTLSHLVFGQRGDLKKMNDLPKLSETEWHAIFALRLAVLFHRARLPLMLPENLKLAYISNGETILSLPKTWLDDNPLTAAALQAENEQWQKVGRKLIMV
ncbi:MAG: exopolyphosphatase [Alysiella sp.]|uniref:exopolyphosphatase n=1 Tax=Alysiella sp. TaxID=1872483 RepID=UPI0026DC3D7F|nr:exopolyphosphatase [Alysiella sp.]MDO4433307.1 exopolyphosphatase [Alysiella sp.]